MYSIHTLICKVYIFCCSYLVNENTFSLCTEYYALCAPLDIIYGKKNKFSRRESWDMMSIIGCAVNYRSRYLGDNTLKKGQTLDIHNETLLKV